MQIQVNTDKNIEGKEALENFIADKVKNGLKHYTDHLTRIEIYLTDENANKGGSDDMHCKIEARPQGLNPITVTGKKGTKEQALGDAIDKMKNSLSKVIGKRQSV